MRIKGREFSSAILEWKFGWAPLANDIGNAINVLQDGIPPLVVKALATATKSGLSQTVTPVFGLWQSIDRRTWTQTTRVAVGCKVKIENPNLHLANRLGFVNLGSVVWELIPFSFVVDYFLNVGSFLNSFTELHGLSLYDEWNTYMHEVPQTWTYQNTFTESFLLVSGTWKYMRRQALMLPHPGLYIQPFWRVSAGRAITSIALLTQALTGRQ
jgi:hypothetical protein